MKGKRLGAVLLAVLALVWGGCATAPASGTWLEGSAGGYPERREVAGLPPLEMQQLLVILEELEETAWGGAVEVAMGCAGQPLPPGWPELSPAPVRDMLAPYLGAKELLEPFLGCTPAEFVALQQRVDMPRLVEALDEWRAVRLGALGPVREDAAEALGRKRADFLMRATERYGAYAEVFALFLVDSAYEDELREMLRRLAREKKLGEVLGRMGAVREALERRGLRLSEYRERGCEWGDVLRGAGEAVRGGLSSSPVAEQGKGANLYARRAELPPPYQEAFDEVEKEVLRKHFSPGNVVVGNLDALTFGVPVGFYHLVEGAGQGAYALVEGEYEAAARELTPVGLGVGLYAGGRGMRLLGRAREAAAWGGMGKLPLPELHEELARVVRQVEARLGGDGLGELVEHIRARREAARFVAVGGVDAAVALHEARGNVGRAQVWLSQAKPRRVSPLATRGGVARSAGGVAALVDEKAGLTEEVVEARLARVELEAPGPRLSGEVAVLERQRPVREAPPAGARGQPLWDEYVAYWEKRLAELKQGVAVKPPLSWAGYGRMRGLFARGLAFERAMVEVLRADAALPRARRRFLQGFENPRIETYVGVWKAETGLRFADVLVIEESALAGPLPRVETFSFKSRNLPLLEEEVLKAQMRADASEALGYYGETLDIRRPSLRHLGSEVQVHRVRLIYEGGALKPRNAAVLKEAVEEAEEKVPGVEVLFQ
ncbi:MAG TPA: hypothetical protein VLQ93_22890 [Myxococcaceae bacterium]|nr:hypothetical protein [Myxococcaceae bacterium]